MKIALFVVTLAAASSTVGLARAQAVEAPYVASEQPPEPRGGRIPAPTQAFEISAAAGYTQGFGSLQSGVGMPSVVRPGLGVDLGLGYRIDPHWAAMIVGQYQELQAERTTAARGLTGGIAFQYHLAPTMKNDPWFELGAGYRVLWENPSIGPTLTSHGFELARVRLGWDVRAGEQVAIGPVIGAGLDMFLFQDLPNVSTNISDPRLSTFVYAGLQGRFDVGGKTELQPRSLASR